MNTIFLTIIIAYSLINFNKLINFDWKGKLKKINFQINY